MRSAALAALVLLAVTATAFARPGDVDPDFGTVQLGYRNLDASGVVALPDGGIRVLVGYPNRLVALRADGRRDRAFGENGSVRAPAGSRGVLEIAPGSGRRVMLLDRRRRGRVAVSAFTPSGRLDRRYGRGGRVLVRANVRDLAANPQGGSLWLGGGRDALRLTRAGRIAWRAQLDPGDHVQAIAPFGAGAVVLVGRWPARGAWLVRLDARGRQAGRIALDQELNGGVLAAAGDRVLIAATTTNRPLLTVLRPRAASPVVLPARTYGIGASLEVVDADLEPGGKVLLAGAALHAYEPRMAIARLNRDGTPDRSFGRRGLRRVPLPDLDRAYPNDMAVRDGVATLGGVMSDEGGDIREDYGSRWPAVARVTLR